MPQAPSLGLLLSCWVDWTWSTNMDCKKLIMKTLNTNHLQCRFIVSFILVNKLTLSYTMHYIGNQEDVMELKFLIIMFEMTWKK
jgi:hypothetical protein